MDTVTPVGILIHSFLVVFTITQLCPTGTGLPESTVIKFLAGLMYFRITLQISTRTTCLLAFRFSGALHQNTELDSNVPPSIEI